MSRSTSVSSAFEEGSRSGGSARAGRTGPERRGRTRARSLAFACVGAIALAAGGAGSAQAAALPDNRGWEIVTPPEQNMDAWSRFWARADGNAIAFQSFGAFSGALNGFSNGYLTTRGAGGWTTQAHTPPGGSGRPFTLNDISDDGGRTTWQGQTLSSGSPKNEVWLKDSGQPAVNVSAHVQGVDTNALYMGRSGDLGHVLFGISPRVIAGSVPDPIQLYDHTGGVTKPVGILPGETMPAPGGSVLGSYDDTYSQGSVRNAVSADGSKIFFESPAPPRDAYVHYPYWPTGLYVRENGTTSTLIDPWATFWGAAVDGSTVVYTTSDRGTGDRGLSIFDVATKTPKQIVPTSAQVQGVGGIADDASRIYFVALARLADGATAGEANVYLYDGGSRLRFVATVNPTQLSGDPGEAAGWGGKGMSIGATSDLSADGRIFVFASRRQLTSYDNRDRFALYVFDADRPTAPLVCASCRPDGLAPTDHVVLRDNSDSNAQAPPAPMTNVTDDGRRIFFMSPDPLDPRDVNAQRDVYVWQDGRAHLISSGMGEESKFIVATPSGDDVFFATPNVLVPQNVTGGLRVIYDARVNGGFAPPIRLTPCEQDGTCQGPPTAPPAHSEPGSIVFTGPGNVIEQLPGAKKPPAFKVGAISRKARLHLARTGRVTIKVRVGAAGKVSAAMRAKVGKRTRRIAHASRTAGKAGTVRLTLRLSKSARSELRQGRRLRVRTVVRYSKVSGVRQASFTLAGAKKKGGR